MIHKEDKLIFENKTGGVTTANPVWLAPLAGITNHPVRKFFRRLGAGLVHTEMVSCAGLTRGMDKTTRMLDFSEEDTPLVLQLFAGDTKTLLKGADIAVSGRPFAALGINMACPMPKVRKKGAGAALIDKPNLAFEMVRELKGRNIPVWVKIRKCPEGHPLGTLKLCEGLLGSGASHITIHGRTPSQRYEGRSDRRVIEEAAKVFRSRISASGDIFSPEDVSYFLGKGCSAVFIARGALKDPFIFPKSLERLGYNVPEELADPDPSLQMQYLIELGNDLYNCYGDRFADVMVKKIMAGMFKSIPGITSFRRAAAALHGWTDLRILLKNTFTISERRII